MPDFGLENTDGGKTNTVGLLGKPTVLSLLNSWSPTTSEQLRVLSELQSNTDINIYTVAIGEKTAKLKAYNTISGLQLNWLADPDSSLVDLFNPQAQPTHYFIDRKGIVQQVITGVLSQEELIQNLTKL